jgi:hypothetical protein
MKGKSISYRGAYKAGVLNKNKKEYKVQQKYCYFGKTFKEQAREVHVRII